LIVVSQFLSYTEYWLYPLQISKMYKVALRHLRDLIIDGKVMRQLEILYSYRLDDEGKVVDEEPIMNVDV
jgi:hypothetical protein